MALPILAVIESQGLARQVLEAVLAQQAAPGAGGSLTSMLPMLLMMFAVFYFLLIRPQQKQAKEHKTMLAALKKGDPVVTQGGIIGRVHAVSEKFIVIEAARDVRLRVLPNTIAAKAPEGLMEEGEPKTAEAKSEKT